MQARFLTYQGEVRQITQIRFRECGLRRFSRVPKRAEVSFFTNQKCRLRNQYCIGKPDEYP